MLLPLHPQCCPGQPDRLRWITPTGVLPFTGPVAAAPPPLAALLADATLAAITLEPAAVVTRLGEGRTWPEHGARVRTALHAALDDPTGWTPAATADDRCDDAALYAAAGELLDGPLGRLARSHGGRIDLIDAHDGVVTVRLGGACHGCPAARTTLHQRLEHQLRHRYPNLRGLTDLGAPTIPARLLRRQPSP